MQKGGVGKSQNTLNLADALARDGHHVLVVDFDPQGSLTTVLNLDSPRLTLTDALFATEKFPTDDLMVTSGHNAHLAGSVHYVPRTPDAFTLESRLPTARGREYRLARILDAIEAEHPGRFTEILIDCPPSLGALTDAVIVAVRRKSGTRNGVLISMMAESLCVAELPLLLSQIRVIEDVLNLEVVIHGMVVNRYNEGKGDAVVELYEALVGLAGKGLPILATVRERTALYEEANRKHVSAVTLAPSSDLAGWYGEVAKAIREREVAA